MPSKTCPECGAVHGSRKLTCDCGHDFACKRNGQTGTPHPLYPEPGAWVADKVKGMPDISPPEPLPKGPIDAPTVKEIVSYEGLGYTLYSYIPAKRISDPKLRKLWQDARAGMQKIVEYLEDVPLST